MASVNRVFLLGRLTKDPECRVFANGGKVANFSLAVDNKRKDQSTGQYVNDPVFLDCSAFNQDKRKLADLVEQYLAKGKPVYIEGKLKLESWQDKTSGEKRSKMKIDVQDIQLLDSRQQGQQSSQDNDSAPANNSADDLGF